jgi:hypothetical protein
METGNFGNLLDKTSINSDLSLVNNKGERIVGKVVKKNLSEGAKNRFVQIFNGKEIVSIGLKSEHEWQEGYSQEAGLWFRDNANFGTKEQQQTIRDMIGRLHVGSNVTITMKNKARIFAGIIEKSANNQNLVLHYNGKEHTWSVGKILRFWHSCEVRYVNPMVDENEGK